MWPRAAHPNNLHQWDRARKYQSQQPQSFSLDRVWEQLYIIKRGSYVREAAMAAVCFDIKKVTATDFRDRLKDYLKAARANRVVLVENRRQPAKYLVDKEFLDSLVKERESIIATMEILTDRDLTDRLLHLSKTIDDDVAAGRLLRTADVFGA